MESGFERTKERIVDTWSNIYHGEQRSYRPVVIYIYNYTYKKFHCSMDLRIILRTPVPVNKR